MYFNYDNFYGLWSLRHSLSLDVGLNAGLKRNINMASFFCFFSIPLLFDIGLSSTDCAGGACSSAHVHKLKSKGFRFNEFGGQMFLGR